MKAKVPQSCGQRNILGLGLYASTRDNFNISEKAKLAEFPWLVAIEVEQKKICSGSLINEKVIITSAECVVARKAESLQVRAGSWKSSAKVGLQTEEVCNVTRIISLDDTVNRFRPSVALIILEKPIGINMFVAATCLKSSMKKLDMNDCLAVGWNSGESAIDDLMVESKIELLSCAKPIQEDNVTLPERTQCANITQKFEMGSAVMCRVDETEMTYLQVGILGYAVSGSSVVFVTNVTEFIEKIDEQFTELALNEATYRLSLLDSRITTQNDVFYRITSPIGNIFRKLFPKMISD